ncbi:hypothetical protein QP938_09425 [Porticoccaceae bacterium LTM1]|nr:hypothetical protein QP938_09425 [Porticoccaceae bacterium LTM1]
MDYRDHKKIQLGDIVELEMPDGQERARVVMLGDTYKHLQLEASFESWVKESRLLESDSIVVEWLGKNPLAHNDPDYAPVGSYMFVAVSEDLKLIERANYEPSS